MSTFRKLTHIGVCVSDMERKPAPAHAMNDLGFTHLSLQVPNLEEEMAELEAAGVDVIRSTFVRVRIPPPR